MHQGSPVPSPATWLGMAGLGLKPVSTSQACSLTVGAMLFWRGPLPALPPAWSPNQMSQWSWGLGDCGLRPLTLSRRRTFYGGAPEPQALLPAHSCCFQRPCRCPAGGLPLPPQRAGQQPSNFQQLIIFTNLQACKKVHSGLKSLGQEPCGKAEGTGPGHRPSRPEAASCPYWASFLGLQAWPRPLQPSRERLPCPCDSEALSTGHPQPPRPPATQQRAPAPHPALPAECRPLHVLFFLPRTPFLLLHQGCRGNDRSSPHGHHGVCQGTSVGVGGVTFDPRLP